MITNLFVNCLAILFKISNHISQIGFPTLLTLHRCLGWWAYTSIIRAKIGSAFFAGLGGVVAYLTTTLALFTFSSLWHDILVPREVLFL